MSDGDRASGIKGFFLQLSDSRSFGGYGRIITIVVVVGVLAGLRACYYENVVFGPVTPDRQIAASSGPEAVATATKVMNNAKQACNISEDGGMLVVEMHSYVEDQNQLLGFARAIADADAVLQGRSRSIFFYDPAGKKIAKADTTNAVRLEN